MKIRTDFVTNSSSNNFAEIVVDNPVLLEILQRYKEQGVFGVEETYFGIGQYRRDDDPYYGFDDTMVMKEIEIPAFSYRESPGYDGYNLIWACPKNLVDLLSEIINVLESYSNYCRFDPNQYIELKEELHDREEEIKNGYLKVVCRYEVRPGGDLINIGDDWKTEFTYDSTNGERYSVVPYNGEDFY